MSAIIGAGLSALRQLRRTMRSTSACPDCGGDHDEPLCNDQAEAATAMQIESINAAGLVCNVEGCTDHHHVWDNGDRLPCLICDPEAFEGPYE